MIIQMYLQGDKDSNIERGVEIGLKEEALGLFKYACYEVKLDVDVDMETGEAVIVAVDGQAVIKKI